MQSIKLTAPAKVNLFLKILDKRKDSYHNILTLFEKISLADELIITKIQNGIEVISDKFITRDPDDNLVYKAARLIISKKKVKRGVRISVRKRIPVAAGMGGGSSDAASALVGINKLFKLRLGEEELGRLAGQLGADCPFFISNMPFAVGRSRGDVLERAPLRLRLWHLIVYPGFKIAARDIYEAFDASAMPGIDLEHSRRVDASKGQAGSGGLTLRSFDKSSGSNPEHSRRVRHGSGSSPEHLPKGLTTRAPDAKIRFGFGDALDFDALESLLYNDLQDIVAAKKRAVGQIIRRLASSLDKKAIVSGSGPSVFCLFKSRREAMRAKDLLVSGIPAAARRGWQIFVAVTAG